MGSLQDALSGHTRLGLDTSIFIYHLEQHPRYALLTRSLLSGIETGQRMAFTSVVTLMEITVRPWQLGEAHIARQYEWALTHFPNLVVAEVTCEIAQQAAQLRAHYRLRPADALQVATALVNGATLLVTNDHDLARLAPALAVVVLDDVLA